MTHREDVDYIVTIKKEHENTFYGARYRGFIDREFTVRWFPNWGQYRRGVFFFFEEELNFKGVKK